MKVTRKKAIQILGQLSNRGDGFDDWWPDMMDDFGLYDEENDTFPSIFDIFEAIGVSVTECRDANI